MKIYLPTLSCEVCPLLGDTQDYQTEELHEWCKATGTRVLDTFKPPKDCPLRDGTVEILCEDNKSR